MSTSITVDVSEVVAKLDPEKLNTYIGIAMKGASDIIRADLRTYPPKSNKKMVWASDKQRRGFFAKLKAGEIEVPYRRGQSPGSEKLGSSWKRKLTREPNMSLEIGTRVSYAPYVMDKDQQAAYHKGNWPTVQGIVDKRANDVKRFIVKALERWAR